MNSSHSLFMTIPGKDHFHLFKQGEPDGEKIVSLLGYKNKDISTAANIPIKSVRYDKKMPLELKERLSEWATAINLVADFFKDKDKTILWFRMPNPLLGGISPKDMIRVGRFKKLLKFIQSALSENQR
jgi:hypothetical protein